MEHLIDFFYLAFFFALQLVSISKSSPHYKKTKKKKKVKRSLEFEPRKIEYEMV